MDNSGDAPRKPSGDSSPDARWVTYDELSEIRGIGRESAVKLVQRKGWRRIRGNDGEARILVPQDWLTPAKTAPEDTSPDNSPDLPRVMAALEAALAGLTTRAERAEAAADREHARADRAELDLEAERKHGDSLREQLTQVRANAEKIEAARVQERARAETAESGLAMERTRVDGLQAQLAQAKSDARNYRGTARSRDALC